MKYVVGESLLNAFSLLGACIGVIHSTPGVIDGPTIPLLMYYLVRTVFRFLHFFIVTSGLPCNLKLLGCSLLLKACCRIYFNTYMF